ncbi:HPr family phosphocarrier protein [Proteocatella sphenisci]|uniref:HPr family phosphocarrier protein n=1 Tax=Proteocatella sphenisci TaxID=181070 RepID=UPI00048D0A8A|nr:HPr family phosphocarrier protein [Proteocatella sphenisci]
MIKVAFEIKNRLGLHARPAATFVQACNKYKSEINLIFNNRAVNAKSIIGILALGVAYGDKIEVEADGPDEAAAMEEIKELLEIKLIEMS